MSGEKTDFVRRDDRLCSHTLSPCDDPGHCWTLFDHSIRTQGRHGSWVASIGKVYSCLWLALRHNEADVLEKEDGDTAKERRMDQGGGGGL
jgi:hypothetical protein